MGLLQGLASNVFKTMITILACKSPSINELLKVKRRTLGVPKNFTAERFAELDYISFSN